MPEINMIIGYGETLTQGSILKRSGGDKAYPYSIQEQRDWLSPQFADIFERDKLQPAESKPHDESVIRITLHPAFLAKSHHPDEVLIAAGLRCVGSKSTQITPRKMNTKGKPTSSYTAQLFVAGKMTGLHQLHNLLQSSTNKTLQDALCRFEQIDLFAATDKLFIQSPPKRNVLVEVVLHASKAENDILEIFNRYVATLGGNARLNQAIVVGGLTFLPVTIDQANLEALAAFTLVRVVRTMPTLRIGDENMRAVRDVATPNLPDLPAFNQNLKVAVFDGGIGQHGLDKWVQESMASGTEKSTPNFFKHGNCVTSTVLFGPLDPSEPMLNRPYTNIQHFRVIAPSTLETDGIVDIDLYDVLKNIDAVLSSQKFDFINLSLGPNMPIDDDEVHPWTALIDSYLSDGKTLATVAVGNDGNNPWPECRIQPPADMVNAIAVGACDSRSANWQRAPYSSYGPGRSPGMVKPDGLAFGGSEQEPFRLYNPWTNEMADTSGTSFSAPALLRIATGIKASLDFDINLLTVRALLKHLAMRNEEMAMSEVGHGRFPQSVEEVMLCSDNEVRVIYQGVLTAGKNLRAIIPFPTLQALGKITLSATLCFASKTDPEHALNYTRAGLTVVLRPKGNQKGTKQFFSAGKMYTSELNARQNEHKWETTLKHQHTYNIGTLADPIFDITYGARAEGKKIINDDLPALPYAMVISLKVENTPGVYNNILQRYQTLQPLRLRQEIQIQTKY
jgi:hypothetical protein